MVSRSVVGLVVVMAFICCDDTEAEAKAGEMEGINLPSQHPVSPGRGDSGHTGGVHGTSGAARACYHQCAEHPKSTALEFVEETMTMLREVCYHSCADETMGSELEDPNAIGEGQETVETAPKTMVNASPPRTSSKGSPVLLCYGHCVNQREEATVSSQVAARCFGQCAPRDNIQRNARQLLKEVLVLTFS